MKTYKSKKQNLTILKSSVHYLSGQVSEDNQQFSWNNLFETK